MSTIGVRLMMDFVIRFSRNRIILFKFMFSNFKVVARTSVRLHPMRTKVRATLKIFTSPIFKRVITAFYQIL